MGGTGELAGTTLDTGGDVLGLHLFPHLLAAAGSQQEGLQSHRTGTHALGTTDAGLRLLAACIIVGEHGHGVRSLADRNLRGGKGLTHHRTTGQYLIVALGQTATGINQLTHGRTHANQEVAGILQLLTGHGGVTFEQWFVLHNCLIHSIGSTYILNNRSNIDRDGWRCRHLTADHGIYELLFTTLRIFLGQGYNLHLEVGAREFLSALLRKQFDGCGLIVLNADIADFNLCCHHQQFESHQNLISFLHHQTEVGCDIRLALNGIDNDALSLGSRRRT